MDDRSPPERLDLPDPFRVGDWRVHLSTNRISRRGSTVRLEPRTMKVLALLAEKAGDTVTRERLEGEVWQGRVVGYESLSNTIAQLRKAFGDDPHDPRFIETIPKVGYRLIAPVSTPSADRELPVDVEQPGRGNRETGLVKRPRASDRRIGAVALFILVSILAVTAWFVSGGEGSRERAGLDGDPFSQLDRPSIAVLPFTNMSDDSSQEYFSDGITDDLITDLSKVSGLLVVARNSSFAYKDTIADIRDIARELGVRYVLEGSVRRAEDQIRINAQLVDATTGVHLWAERYDGAPADVFNLQDQVTRKIVQALKVRLTARERAMAADLDTDNPAAYDAFLKGWAHQLRKTPEDAVQAIVHFKRALELDPNYSRAYAALAQIFWDNSVNLKFNILMDPTARETSHGGYTSYVNAWTYLRKAQARSSSQAHALAARMLQRQRRFDEAIEQARMAVAVGPNDPTAYDALIEILIYAGQSEEAIKLADETIRLDPRLPGEKLFLKGMVHYASERLEEALSAIERARMHNPDQFRYGAIRAAALAELGRQEEAKVALEQYLSGWTTYTTLNWIMFHWPFQRLETAERLANALMKAGLLAPLERYYRITNGDRLTGTEIKALIAHKVMIGADRSFYGEAEFEITRDKDAQIVGQGFLTYFRDGRTRIEDGLLCDPWYTFGDYCVAVFRNPDGRWDARNEYVFFTLMGTFSFSVFDLPS